MSELLINNKDALSYYGIRMGKNFIENLETPIDQGEYITNTVRTEDGDRIIPIRPKINSRYVTLEFQIIGVATSDKTAHESYEARKTAFDTLCNNGFMTISVPGSRSDVYRLYAQRKSSSYAKGKVNYGEVGKVSVRFYEPNPTDRGSFDTDDASLLSMKSYDDYVNT